MTTTALSDVNAERAQIDAEIAGLTVPAALAATVETQGDTPAYSDLHTSDGTGWRTITWREFRESALDLATELINLGLEPGERVCIMASSRIEHVVTDAAVLHAGGIPISVYATLSPSQVQWYGGHAAPSIVVLEGADQLARWADALADATISAGLKAVIVLDESAVGGHLSWTATQNAGRARRAASSSALDERIAGLQVDEPATILYTSGTTGDPKAVVLTHHNVLFEACASTHAASLIGPGISLSYLPMAHIAERILGLYLPQVMGGHVHFISDPAALPGALAEVRPTRFFGVPRVWEKIMAGVSGLLAMEPDADKKAAIAGAMDTGRRYIESLQWGETTSPDLKAQFEAVDAAVLKPMRGLLGLDRVEWSASAAAPMPPAVAAFFAGLGLQIVDVYGMTETSSAVAATTPAAYRMGTVGRALPGIEIRLAEDGEILARGPIQTPGYYRNEAATADLVDADGWVHTGDIGTMDADGFLKVVDRKKEMIINSSGKNIAPTVIENYVKESALVGHAMVVGEARNYLVALITLDGEMAPRWAAAQGIEDVSLASLARDDRVLAAVAAGVEAANDRVSRPEQIKKFEVLPVEWTAESAELTPTLKLKRRVVTEMYADVIDRLYS